MNSHDQAAFEQWLERAATEEERKLPYEKQLESHILWLSGCSEMSLSDIAVTDEDRKRPQ